MVRRCISYWNCPFLGDMLVFPGVQSMGIVGVFFFVFRWTDRPIFHYWLGVYLAFPKSKLGNFPPNPIHKFGLGNNDLEGYIFFWGGFDTFSYPWRIHVTIAYLPTWMVAFYGFHVGKYTIVPWIRKMGSPTFCRWNPVVGSGILLTRQVGGFPNFRDPKIRPVLTHAMEPTHTPERKKKGNIHKPTNFWEIQPLVDSGMFFLKTRDEAVCCYTLENEHGTWTSPIWKGTKTSELLNQTFTILFQPFIFRGRVIEWPKYSELAARTFV